MRVEPSACFFVVCSLLVALTTELGPTTAHGAFTRVRNLDTGQSYLTIQEAINAPETLDGQTLFVDAGTYHENVVLNKSVTVLGESPERTVIRGNGSGATILVDDTDNVTVLNLAVTGGDVGIYLSHSSWCKIIKTSIFNCTSAGIKSGPGACSWNTIYRNQIADCGFGIYATGGHHEHYQMTENKITQCEDGIRLNTPFYFDNGTISGNTISNDNGYAINLTWCIRYCTISGNIFADNYGGIYYSAGADVHWNRIYFNSFIGNTIELENSGPSDQNIAVWDNGYPSGGNFWSDYAGTDSFSGAYQNETGHDGIGDTPYTLDSHNQDKYPLMYEGGFVHVGINVTNSDFVFPLYSALNFTYVVDSPMSVGLDATPTSLAGVAIYAKWDGTQPSLDNYDAHKYGGQASKSYLRSPTLLPGRYYFMVYVAASGMGWWPDLFDITVTGYLTTPSLKDLGITWANSTLVLGSSDLHEPLPWSAMTDDVLAGIDLTRALAAFGGPNSSLDVEVASWNGTHFLWDPLSPSKVIAVGGTAVNLVSYEYNRHIHFNLSLLVAEGSIYLGVNAGGIKNITYYFDPSRYVVQYLNGSHVQYASDGHDFAAVYAYYDQLNGKFVFLVMGMRAYGTVGGCRYLANNLASFPTEIADAQGIILHWTDSNGDGFAQGIEMTPVAMYP